MWHDGGDNGVTVININYWLRDIIVIVNDVIGDILGTTQRRSERQCDNNLRKYFSVHYKSVLDRCFIENVGTILFISRAFNNHHMTPAHHNRL